MAELSYPPYPPREGQFEGVESTPLALSWPSLPQVSGSTMVAAGFGLEAFGQLAQGIVASKRARRIADYNAQVTGANAQAQAQAAEIEALQHTRQAAFAEQDQAVLQQAQVWRDQRAEERQAFLLGTSRAVIGASGLMASGSPLLVMEETVRQQALDTLAEHYSTALQVRASQVQAEEARYAAEVARYGAGERLRVGRAAAGLIHAEADTSGLGAGLLRATSTLARGAATYSALRTQAGEA